MTWTLILFNFVVFLLTQTNIAATQEQLEKIAQNEELTRIQGRIFAGYILDHPTRYPAAYQKIAENVLVRSDEDQRQLLGTLAMRDSFFYNDVSGEVSGTDEFERAWWREKSKEVIHIRESHAGYALGVTDTSNGPLQWLTYQFVHSDNTHFLVNMSVFLLFGAALEAVIGSLALLLVFLASGVGAAAIYLMIDEVSAIPLIGASGAVSGIVTLFCVLFWNHGIRHFYFLFVPAKGYLGYVYVPGWIVLLLWMASDLTGYFSTPGELGGVAYSAHMGGEICGVIMALGYLLYFKHYPQAWREKVEHENAQTHMLGPALKTEPL